MCTERYASLRRMTPLEISTHLRRAKLPPVLAWAKEWTQTATYGDIQRLVAQVPARERDHFVLLLRDVLSGYPEVTHGLPVLFRYTDANNGSMHLPLPEHAPPDPSIRSMSWLSLATLRDGRRFGLPRDSYIEPGGMHCAVLLVQTAGPTEPELSDEWWSELLEIPEHASLSISSRAVLPWPDAVEAGCALLSAARTGGTNVETPRLFLSSGAWDWALTAGLEWRRTLAAQGG